jgi:hypothetical protein
VFLSSSSLPHSDSFRHFWIISSIRVDFLFFTHRESSLSLARAHIHGTRKSKLAPVGLEYIVFEKHAKNDDDCFFRSKHERDGIFIFFFFCHDYSKKWRTRHGKWKTSRRNEIFIFTFVSRGRKRKQKKIDKIDGSSSSSR